MQCCNAVCHRYSHSSITQGCLDIQLEDTLKPFRREQVRQDISNDLSKACATAQQQYSYLRSKGLRDLAQVFWHATANEFLRTILDGVLAKHSQQVAQLVSTAVCSEPSHQDAWVSTETDGRDVTEAEQISALIVLEVLCLLHKPTCTALCSTGIIQLLIQRSASGTAALATASLNALLALLADEDANQQLFLHVNGVEQVCQILTSSKTPTALRQKLAEFLILVMKAISQLSNENAEDAAHPCTEIALLLQLELGVNVSNILLKDLIWNASRKELQSQLDAAANALLVNIA